MDRETLSVSSSSSTHMRSSTQHLDGPVEKLPLNTKLETPDNLPTDDNTIKGDVAKQKEDFPDGGLRAWLVVFGVCLLLFPPCTFHR